jgi:protein-L-isoaspartate(D-aspartate) O-methyltransferase
LTAALIGCDRGRTQERAPRISRLDDGQPAQSAGIQKEEAGRPADTIPSGPTVGGIEQQPAGTVPTEAPARRVGEGTDDSRFALHRQLMVQRQLQGRDIRDQRVLDAMGRVPRHRFVPESLQDLAYADHPLPIGHRQTISQPYIVALMTQLAQPKAEGRALDVGTGSGYQAAVLAELVDEVYSIEIVQPLAEEATDRLEALGYGNVEVRCGDGYRGWPEKAPFAAIIVAAAPDHIPQPLIDQLAIGGRLVIPVGQYFQNLVVVEKQRDGSVKRREIAPVAFVPMTGEAQGRPLERTGGF